MHQENKRLLEFEIIINGIVSSFRFHLKRDYLCYGYFYFKLFQCGGRLWTLESDAYRRLILTSKFGPRTERVNVPLDVKKGQLCQNKLRPPQVGTSKKTILHSGTKYANSKCNRSRESAIVCNIQRNKSWATSERKYKYKLIQSCPNARSMYQV